MKSPGTSCGLFRSGYLNKHLFKVSDVWKDLGFSRAWLENLQLNVLNNVRVWGRGHQQLNFNGISPLPYHQASWKIFIGFLGKAASFLILTSPLVSVTFCFLIKPSLLYAKPKRPAWLRIYEVTYIMFYQIFLTHLIFHLTAVAFSNRAREMRFDPWTVTFGLMLYANFSCKELLPNSTKTQS